MLPKEAVPPKQRCPKCLKGMLSHDPDTNTLSCSSCGYKQTLQTGGD